MEKKLQGHHFVTDLKVHQKKLVNESLNRVTRQKCPVKYLISRQVLEIEVSFVVLQYNNRAGCIIVMKRILMKPLVRSHPVKKRIKRLRVFGKGHVDKEKGEEGKTYQRLIIFRQYIDILSRHLLKYLKLLNMFSFLPLSKVPIVSISVVTCNKTTAHIGPKLYRLSIYMENVPYYLL